MTMIAANIIAFLLIARFRILLLDYVTTYLKNLNSQLPILAVNTISFLKPKNFYQLLNSLLQKKNLSPELRKATILALSYEKSRKSLKTIIKEFEHKTEKNQLAVLEAVQYCAEYEAVVFLIDVIEGNLPVKSTRTKMRSVEIFANTFGKHAIPIFLRDLKLSTDIRIKANIIEILAGFKDSGLIEYFQEHAKDENNRLRANTLMALYSFKETKIHARHELVKMLKSDIPLYQASSLYVIGKSGDRFFYKAVVNYAKTADLSNPMIKLGIAWVMINLHMQIGFEYLYELFERDSSIDKYTSHIYFYSQMPEYMRFEVIDNLLRSPNITPQKLESFRHQLATSELDFDSELNYLASFSTT
jgi:hypothetical protein